MMVAEENDCCWCDVVDALEKYGEFSKKQLISMAYDESGEGRTKKQLRKMPRGLLLSLVIGGILGMEDVIG